MLCHSIHSIQLLYFSWQIVLYFIYVISVEVELFSLYGVLDMTEKTATKTLFFSVKLNQGLCLYLVLFSLNILSNEYNMKLQLCLYFTSWFQVSIEFKGTAYPKFVKNGFHFFVLKTKLSMSRIGSKKFTATRPYFTELEGIVIPRSRPK